PAAGGRRNDHLPRTRCPGGARAHRGGRGRHRLCPPPRATRARHPAGLPRGGLHGPYPGRRRVPSRDHLTRADTDWRAPMTTAAQPAPQQGRPAPPAGRVRTLIPAKLDFAGVLAAERRKLCTLRSTWWTLGLTIVLMTLMAFGQAAALAETLKTPEGTDIFAGVHSAEIANYGYHLG